MGSKSAKNRMKRLFWAYADGLSIRRAKTPESAKQMLLRICQIYPKIGLEVRPGGGRVTGEQMGNLVRYIRDNPIPGCGAEKFLPEAVAREQLVKKVNANPKIATRVIRTARANHKIERENFYRSWDWKQARYGVLQKHGPVCMCCGATRGDITMDGVPVKIVVDHIKPLSKRWDLRLDPANLQVLCEECNMGKSNVDETDFRVRMAG